MQTKKLPCEPKVDLKSPIQLSSKGRLPEGSPRRNKEAKHRTAPGPRGDWNLAVFAVR